MGEHGDRDHDAHRVRGLKREPDGHAVEQAVNAQYAGGEAAAGRGVAVKQQNSIQNQVRQETERGARQNGRRTVRFPAEFDRFGQQIEECDTDDRAGAESQYQVQFVVQLERQQAAGKRAEKRRDGDGWEQHD